MKILLLGGEWIALGHALGALGKGAVGSAHGRAASVGGYPQGRGNGKD